jgi:hypothetical protein
MICHENKVGGQRKYGEDGGEDTRIGERHAAKKPAQRAACAAGKSATLDAFEGKKIALPCH